MTWDTGLTRLVGCTVPIQQAGFGSSLNVELAAAVGRAGGLGTLGGSLGDAAVLGAACDEYGALTDAPVAVNFVEPFFDRDRGMETLAVAAERCAVVEFFYGEPDPALVEAIHAGGALAGWQVGSVAEARRAEAAGVDLVTLQGIEAGGHVRATRSLWPMLAEALEVVGVPIVAAGGISSPRAMAAALAAGAAGVRMGTRFVASVEADFHADYKALLVDAEGDATVYTERFRELWPDAPHRVLRRSIAAAEAGEGRDGRDDERRRRAHRRPPLRRLRPGRRRGGRDRGDGLLRRRGSRLDRRDPPRRRHRHRVLDRGRGPPPFRCSLWRL